MTLFEFSIWLDGLNAGYPGNLTVSIIRKKLAEVEVEAAEPVRPKRPFDPSSFSDALYHDDSPFKFRSSQAEETCFLGKETV